MYQCSKSTVLCSHPDAVKRFFFLFFSLSKWLCCSVMLLQTVFTNKFFSLRTHNWFYTYIDQIFVVSDEQISQNARFVQITQTDHILNAMYGRCVHCLNSAIWRQPMLIAIIIPDCYPSSLCRNYFRPYRYIELIPRDWFYPNIIALERNKRRHVNTYAILWPKFQAIVL